MVTEIFRGENKLIEYEIADDDGNGILFTSLVSATVVLEDYSGNTITKTTTAGDIIQGSTTTSILFEVLITDLDSLDVGLITAQTTIKTTDGDFTGNQAVQTRKDELLLAIA